MRNFPLKLITLIEICECLQFSLSIVVSNTKIIEGNKKVFKKDHTSKPWGCVFFHNICFNFFRRNIIPSMVNFDGILYLTI